MAENKTAETLSIIGYLNLILGIFAGVILLANNSILGCLIAAVSGAISCVVFIGFSEIINLLQKSNNIQGEILQHIKSMSPNDNNSSKLLLDEIESNLPEM